MNYSQALKYLDGFINYEKIPPKQHAEFNLARMQHGLEVLGHPEKKFFPILIAGTVGKGSTGFFLEQILKSAKISCGFYHSPHIDTVRERIRVNGLMLSEKKWAEAITEIRKQIKKNPFPKKLGEPTYFEILTLLAIWICEQAGVKIGIFEIGMGGRLDATNVLQAPLCFITKIDFDHQAFLGNTLSKIALEKAGIIKDAQFVISAPQAPQAAQIIQKMTAKRARKLVFAKPIRFQPGLFGGFQKQNAGNAATGARILRDKLKFKVSEKAIQTGLKQANWPGRLESLRCGRRQILMDAAHNLAGCHELENLFSKGKKKPSVILFSALRDKETASMLKVLSRISVPVIVTELHHPRAKKLADLAAEAEAFFDKIILARDVRAGIKLLMKMTPPGKCALVTGSFYLLSEVRKIMRSK